MHVYFLRVFTYTEVMGLAKVAACLSKREPKYFLSFWFTLSFELSVCLSVIFILCVCICLIFTWTYLCIRPCIYLWFPTTTLQVDSFALTVMLFLAFILSFFFVCVFSFLDPVLPAPQLLTLNGSVYKLQSVGTHKIFPVYRYILLMCIKYLALLI